MSSLTVLSGVRTVQLTRGANTLVDEADYALVASTKWQLNGGPSRPRRCAVHNYWDRVGRKNRMTYMSRVLMGDPVSGVVDHVNGDSLDNRRSNLRICTNSQNHMNNRKPCGKARFKGVDFNEKTGRWRSRIGFGGRFVHIGYFATEQEAARAYDRKAVELFGDFAAINAQLFPELMGRNEG